MTTFYNTFIEPKKSILIPRLQRDYVQGSNEGLIGDFIHRLELAVSTGENEDLNYIYGKWCKDFYIPIDGQQRLTTLWLLHLYAYSCSASAKDETFPVKLCFSSREYAQNFCDHLVSHLYLLVRNFQKEKGKWKGFNQFIENQPWFLKNWEKDHSVRSMLSALRTIQKRANITAPDDNFYQRLCKNDSITFRFFPIEGKLNDDVYIKMNGRGLQLTDYDILKSWMDGKMEELCDNRTTWLSRFQSCQKRTDNEWTELIWNNRPKGKRDSLKQDISYKIDYEQIRFIYNAIIIQWSKNPSSLLVCHRHTENDSQYRDKIDEISRMCGMEKELSNLEFGDFLDTLQTKMLTRFREDDEFYLPLFLLDRLELFSKDQFFSIFKMFESFYQASLIPEKSWLFANDEKTIYMGLKPDTNNSLFCQLALSKPTYSKLCLLLAASNSVSFAQHSATSFFDWMRVMRNLINGTTISNENFKNILIFIDRFARKCKVESIYQLIEKDSISHSAFSQTQVNEEVWKAGLVLKDASWLKILSDFENCSFCNGSIGFIKQYLPEVYNQSEFKKYSVIFWSLFNNGGIRQEHSIRIQRALMCYSTPHAYCYSYSGNEDDKWQFMSNFQQWRRFVEDDTIHQGDTQPMNTGLKNIVFYLYENLYTEDDGAEYDEPIKQRVGDLLRSIYLKELSLDQPTITDWRRFFIKYSEVWSAMDSNIMLWHDEFDIVLLNKTRNRDGGKHELRAWCFFQDIKRDRDENSQLFDGWEEPWFYKAENTCMDIMRNSRNNHKLKIDLYHERKREDNYTITFFYQRAKGEEMAQVNNAIQADLSSLAESLGMLLDTENFLMENRFVSRNLSEQSAKEMFYKLLDKARDL